MPYLHVQTNSKVQAHEKTAFLEAVTDTIATELNKQRAYVMAAVETELSLNFDSSEVPAAFMELKVLGLDPAKNANLAAAFAKLAWMHLHVPEDRCFSRFVDTPRGHWGLGDTVF